MALNDEKFMAYVENLIMCLRSVHRRTFDIYHYGQFETNNFWIRQACTEWMALENELKQLGFGIRLRGQAVDVYPIISIA